MICPKCNQQIPDGSKFCQMCGTNLSEYVQPVSEPEQPTPEPYVHESAGEPVQPTPEPYVSEPASEPEQPTPEPYVNEPAGEPVQPGPNPYVQPNPYPANGMGYAPNMPETKVKKGLPKPALFGIIGGGIFLFAAIVTLLIVFLVVNKTMKFNLQSYTTVEYSGVNGQGTVSARIDDGRLS
ncbi:MAG: zinc-ribbon domain-containing protein, partial [Eubacterium sp.]|nr:zinc-ribbon domain-containing protein [Eubacterium sp.]